MYVAALNHLKETRKSVILDFSIWSDVIFATKHFEDGFLTAEQLEEYMSLSRSIFALDLPPPHLSIILQADPAVCLERTTRSTKPTVRTCRAAHLS